MTYLEEFATRIAVRDYSKVMELWQEYCGSDIADSCEIREILNLIKGSDIQLHFGSKITEILELVQSIDDEEQKLGCLATIFDIQTTQSEELWNLAHQIVEQHFSKVQHLQEKLRLVGLRTKDNFQGAITNLILLNHIKNGAFVFHTPGWGVGEIINCSFIREQITVEFENLGGISRDITFKNAYKSLKPLTDAHFLTLRYSQPEILGKLALEDPVGLITKIISDIGPKTSLGIKDLLSGSIIDEGSYSKWWQGAKNRMKRDSRIAAPEHSPKGNYTIQKCPPSLNNRIENSLKDKKSFEEKFSAIYSLTKDIPQLLKRGESAQKTLIKEVETLFEEDKISPIQRILSYFLIDMIDGESAKKYAPAIATDFSKIKNYEEALASIHVAPFKKKFLSTLKEIHLNWEPLFSELFLQVSSSQQREHISKELTQSESGKKMIESCLEALLENPMRNPEAFFWHFQKCIDGIEKGNGKESYRLQGELASKSSPQNILERLFEIFLSLYSTIEFRQDQRELVKKMYAVVTQEKFKLVRLLLKESSLVYAKEFLLLASKCRSLTDHDHKILRSLVQVVHPSLADKRKDVDEELSAILWATEESYQRIKEKIHHIGTVEVVDNAREIEEARKHGDLRENSEYKFALERRARLQKELKELSDQFQSARILTPNDIATDTVGIGTKIDLRNPKGELICYTILGPWDADTETNIIALESKIAQAMLGKERKASIDLKGEKMQIEEIRSIFA